MNSSLYRQVILNHYKHPQNKRWMPDATQMVEHKNANCGDHLKLFLKIDAGVVTDVSFVGEGCALSVAGASLLTGHIQNMPIEDVRKLTPDTVFTLLGTTVTPGRLHCALLSFEALGKALSMV